MATMAAAALALVVERATSCCRLRWRPGHCRVLSLAPMMTLAWAQPVPPSPRRVLAATVACGPRRLCKQLCSSGLSCRTMRRHHLRRRCRHRPAADVRTGSARMRLRPRRPRRIEHATWRPWPRRCTVRDPTAAYSPCCRLCPSPWPGQRHLHQVRRRHERGRGRRHRSTTCLANPLQLSPAYWPRGRRRGPASLCQCRSLSLGRHAPKRHRATCGAGWVYRAPTRCSSLAPQCACVSACLPVVLALALALAEQRLRWQRRL